MHPTYFPSPNLFLPERHLAPPHPLYRAEIIGKRLPGRWSSAGFGFGRRACIGPDLAEHDTFIALAKLIWSFDIEKIEGEAYDIDGHEGVLLVKPKDFGCEFKVRSPKHAEVLGREIVVAREVLEKFPAFEDQRDCETAADVSLT